MNPEATEPAAKKRWRRLGKTFATLIIVLLVLNTILLIYPPKTALEMADEARAKSDVATLSIVLRYHKEGQPNMEFNGKMVSPSGEFLDPWGTPYKIDVSDPKNPKVYSFGPNKRDDGGKGDDVVSWR